MDSLQSDGQTSNVENGGMARPSADGALLAGLAASALSSILALSILFGRAYYLTYHRVIGIPSSADKVDLLEYAIISPDVTIASIGIVLGVLILSYESMFVAARGNLRARRNIVIIQVLGFVIGIIGLLGVTVPSTQFFLSLSTVGQRGILISSFFLIFLLGGNLMAYAAREDSRLPLRNWLDETGLFRLVRLVVIATLIMVVTYGVFDYINKFATSDAERDKTESPKAYLEVSQSMEMPSITSLKEPGQRTFGPVRILLENAEFIYVSNLDISDTGSPGVVFAIPKKHILSIRYLPGATR